MIYTKPSLFLILVLFCLFLISNSFKPGKSSIKDPTLRRRLNGIIKKDFQGANFQLKKLKKFKSNPEYFIGLNPNEKQLKTYNQYYLPKIEKRLKELELRENLRKSLQEAKPNLQRSTIDWHLSKHYDKERERRFRQKQEDKYAMSTRTPKSKHSNKPIEPYDNQDLIMKKYFKSWKAQNNSEIKDEKNEN